MAKNKYFIKSKNAYYFDRTRDSFEAILGTRDLSLCFIFPKEKFAYFHRRAKVDWVGTVGWEQKAVLGQTGFLIFPHCINYKFILCPILLMVFLLSLKYSSWGEMFNCGIAEYE